MNRNYMVAPCLWLAASAHAQTTVPAPDAGSDTGAIQEIVVTAQKRAQNVQDVPMTLSVLSGGQVEEARVDRVGDLANRVPGLGFDNFPVTQPRPAIRGIGSSDRGAAGDPSTAVYVDEVYYGRPGAIAFDAFDVARIEVLKGPQGTLWGKNVVGGLIHIVNQRPTLGDFGASVQTTLGNYDRKDVAAFVNVPLSGTAALRVTGGLRNRDGFARNIAIGGRVDDEDARFVRAQALVEPTERLSVLVAGDYRRDHMAGSNRHTVGVDPSSSRAPVWANAIDTVPDHVRQDTNGYQNRESYGVRGSIDWELDPFTISSITSYRWLDYAAFEDADGGNPTTNRINARGGNFETSRFWSQELRVAAPSSSAVKWVLGAYYYHQNTRRTDSLIVDAPPAPSGTFLARDQFDQRAKIDSYAVFADVTVPLIDAVSVFGGVRYSYDHKDYDLTNANSTALLRAGARYTIEADKGWDKLTYRAGVQYRPAKDIMVYALVSSGFKSGGFQDTPASATSARTPFSPEAATNFEIGAKTRLFDRKLLLNTSVYRIDYSDLQVRRTIGLDTFTVNAGSARIKGLEVEATAGPFGGFTLSGSYALTDGKFRELIDNGQNYSGNRLTRSPHDKLVLSPSFRFDVSDALSVTTTLDYQYESKIYDDFNNNPLTIRPSKTLVDARIVIDHADKGLSLSIWGQNLGDKTYITHQFLLLGGHFATYGPPRTYGATLTWRY
ncbi:TonB-dependent receptor [Sphingobium subterraneum]|uniref:Iron complex outermembrane receptor protein n=1 Tax=Sphingobium subterraneum TaxID=627688 RepID=A0A841J5G9_9SPHN|nr:TonB-dependent receptor [Sphingobium subterraneum]MBB6123795.1 iron complex outermembrane receptor protein [Sphingobium subterraneum]